MKALALLTIAACSSGPAPTAPPADAAPDARSDARLRDAAIDAPDPVPSCALSIPPSPHQPGDLQWITVQLRVACDGGAGQHRLALTATADGTPFATLDVLVACPDSDGFVVRSPVDSTGVIAVAQLIGPGGDVEAVCGTLTP